MNLLASPPKRLQNGNSSNSSADDKVSEFEKDVTDLVLGLGKQGGGATPFGGSVQNIKDLLQKDMMPKVIAAHTSNQKELNSLADLVEGCTTTKSNSIKKANP